MALLRPSLQALAWDHLADYQLRVESVAWLAGLLRSRHAPQDILPARMSVWNSTLYGLGGQMPLYLFPNSCLAAQPTSLVLPLWLRHSNLDDLAE